MRSNTMDHEHFKLVDQTGQLIISSSILNTPKLANPDIFHSSGFFSPIDMTTCLGSVCSCYTYINLEGQTQHGHHLSHHNDLKLSTADLQQRTLNSTTSGVNFFWVPDTESSEEIESDYESTISNSSNQDLPSTSNQKRS